MIGHLGEVSARRVLARRESGGRVNPGIPMGILGTLSVPGVMLVEPDRLLSSLGEASVIGRDVLQRTVLGRDNIVT